MYVCWIIAQFLNYVCWYFVFKIVLTYCEKQIVLAIEKNVSNLRLKAENFLITRTIFETKYNFFICVGYGPRLDSTYSFSCICGQFFYWIWTYSLADDGWNISKSNSRYFSFSKTNQKMLLISLKNINTFRSCCLNFNSF